MLDQKCDHIFEYLRTAKSFDYGGYQTHFVRVDTFYCNKCLEYKEIRKEGYSRETPEWYLGD